MKKLLSVIFIAVILIAGYAFSDGRHTDAGNRSTDPDASDKVTITNPFPEVKVEEPVHLSIPKISVDAKIENVGLTDKNAMDTPKTKGQVGWYDLGAKPGEKGSAVMAGHLDDKNGDPEVFYDLKNLSPGDEIETEDKSGRKYEFVVTKVESYPQESFPLETVFASNDKTHLNLITCEGVFDKSSRLYSKRLVVFSELKE